MKNNLKLIGKSVLAASLITASYIVGLNQNPSFQELPPKAQEAVFETHHDLDKLLDQSVEYYQTGDPKKALELYNQIEQKIEALETIDPKYESLEARLFQYESAIIDTAEIVFRIIDSVYENVVAGTPDRIAEYVIFGGSLSWVDQHLENIGPDSVAYNRLKEDKTSQTALLNYYIDSSLRWYDAQEKMREILIHVPNKNEKIERAIEILTGRIELIQQNREWINQFKTEISK